MTQTSTVPAARPLSRGRVVFCLALLALMAFSLGCSEFVVIGVESELASDLGVSLAEAGQLISSTALAYAVMTPVLALTTGRFRRYSLLLAYSAVFIAANALSAFAGSFALLLVARVLLGTVSGALLAVCVTYIPELVSVEKSSLAISAVYGAFSVAMVIMTSVGKFLADTVGWRVAMDAALVVSLVACAGVAAFLPREGSTDEPATFAEQARLFAEPCIITGMLIFLFGVGSVYVFYGYVTPYLEQVLGMGTMAASTTLMVYGAFTFVSNILGGLIDARFGMKALLVTFALQGAVLLGLFFAGSDQGVAIVLIYAIAVLMYLFSVSCISVFMRVARERHPKAMVLASSLEPMAFNVGISFGTVVGGAVVEGPGLAWSGLVGAAFAVVAWVLTLVTIRLSKREARAGAAGA